MASDFGVPQHRRRLFAFGLRDGLSFKEDFAETALALIGKRTQRAVTVREALSDLPEAVSKDDGPIPYPKKRGGRYSDYQKLMRLDWDYPLLPSAHKRAGLAVDTVHNHHTKGVEARRKVILTAIRPGIRSGQDVLRALGLGSKGTMIGGAFLYGLGAMGETGVRLCLIMAKELSVTRELCGSVDINAVNSSVERRR